LPSNQTLEGTVDSAEDKYKCRLRQSGGQPNLEVTKFCIYLGVQYSGGQYNNQTLKLPRPPVLVFIFIYSCSSMFFIFIRL